MAPWSGPTGRATATGADHLGCALTAAGPGLTNYWRWTRRT
ncbi:hypothetical protein [Streptomyces sp. CBMA156]|nr:hypothetical protein [Streptomyces sp. CBMA156]